MPACFEEFAQPQLARNAAEQLARLKIDRARRRQRLAVRVDLDLRQIVARIAGRIAADRVIVEDAKNLRHGTRLSFSRGTARTGPRQSADGRVVRALSAFQPRGIAVLPEAADRDCWRDRRTGVVTLRADPDAEQDPRPIAPIIFDRWREADRAARRELLLHQRSAAPVAAAEAGPAA